ncbi:hypothetical protein [Streptosporangium sp. NPDC051022]|uniref:hypothetical protein n=1 Tax=Streptosporangium sp. NPDC051022 TaxID=3155752 RepID=UPI0034174F98
MSTDPYETTTTSRSPLDTAEHIFRLVACAPAGLALDGRALGPDLPRRHLLLPELRDLLISHPLLNSTRDAVWRALVTHARQDGPQWLVGAVGVAVPALRRVSGRICRGYVAGEAEDIDTEVLTAFIEAVRGIDVNRPNLLPRMAAAAKRAGERTRRNAEADTARRLLFHEPAAPHSPWGHPDLVLIDTVAKGVVSGLDAELIGLTRLENRTLADAARALGLTPEAAKKRRQRSEPVLVTAVLGGEVEAAVSLTITSPAPRGVKEEVPMISARSRTSDPQPESTVDPKGGRGSPTGSARIHRGLIGWPKTFVAHGIVSSANARRRRLLRRRVLQVLIVVGVTATIVAVIAVTAFAENGELATAAMPSTGIRAARPPTGPDQLGQVFDKLRGWLIGLLATLATLMLTIGGLRYLVAGGDPGEIQKAKAALKAAALGYSLAVLAPLFVNVLKRIVGG